MGRRPFWLLNPRLRAVPSLLLLLFFFLWSCGGVGEDGDGCSRWSVAGGDDGELLWMQGRLFQLCQYVRDHGLYLLMPNPTFHQLRTAWPNIYIYIY